MRTRREALVMAAAGSIGTVSSAAAQAGVGRVVRRIGSAAAVRGNAIVDLALDDAVFVGDILRTGAASRLLVRCTDGLEIALGPATDLILRSYLTQPSGSLTVLLGLLEGIARLVGGPAPHGQVIQMDTRTAVASVRSTEWLVESTARGTHVLAIVDEVRVAAIAGGEVVLRPGEGTDVPPGASPKAPALWGEAQRRDAIARTTL
jgi:hypothetical protein